jgi:putative lipoprotein
MRFPFDANARQSVSASLLLAAAACSGMHPGSGQSAGLDGVRWRLAELNGAAALPADTTRRPWLRFVADSGRVEGSGGCNRISGTFTHDGSALHFGPMLSTRMACVDTALTRQEQTFTTALASVDRFDRSGEALSLFRGETRVARLVATGP